MDLKIVGLKVGSKQEAQRAYRALDDKHDMGETDYYEVLGIWKSDKGRVHSKYYGNHKRLFGTLVGAYFGLIPALVGYYIGRHEMPKGKVSTAFLDDLAAFVDRGGAAIFALVDEAEAPLLVRFFTETYPGSDVGVIDPGTFEADVALLAAEVRADVE